jgi:hypothetical protein
MSTRHSTCHDSSLQATCRDAATDTVYDTVLVAPADAKRVEAIPVLPDGSPDVANQAHGCIIGARSGGGIVVEVSGRGEWPTTALVLVFREMGRPACCLGLEVIAVRPVDESWVRVEGQFGGFAQELLLPDKLTPAFDPQTCQMTRQFPSLMLNKWADAGVLTRSVWDRVKVCPRCAGLPSYRQGCRACGSIRLDNQRLIHHFACAHVGPVADFDEQGELACPKCRTRHLVVGADYEYLTGPYQCLDCNWNDTELEQVARCLRCDFRFPAHQATERELGAYHAHRLDPLAIVPAPGPAPDAARRPFVDRLPALRLGKDRGLLVGLGR